ncbi:MAG: hypothetical protein NTX23_04465 [Candidatus Bipolaricaulota bacterium]|nr:hypothetical protein [Candidatus Bipolaricaulota bacterium]
MRTRNKVVIGIAAASLAVIGLVLMAAAQGSVGMMSRNSSRMMGGTAAGSTGTCPMTKAQCSAAGAASCPGMASGAKGAAAPCSGMKANGTCRMSTGTMPATCPMTQGSTGA